MKDFRIDVKAAGAAEWYTLLHARGNHQRLVNLELGLQQPVEAIRLATEASWGTAKCRVFS